MATSILCIDDSKVSRTFIKKGLREIMAGNDIVIEEASNARDGIDLCTGKKYDIVLLDLTMPDMSGYDFLAELKEKSIEQKIIVLTADIQPLAEKKVMDLGASGFLEKPFDNDKMLDMLKKTGVL